MTLRQSDEQTQFRPDIEGLRAVAVLAVVLFHAEVPGMGGGYVGVDVFFVISGFLITGLLWRQAHNTGTVRLRDFYAARARRLLPASALVGAITMIASVLLLSPLQVPAVLNDGITSALYVGNIWFIMRGVDYFASHAASPFQHYWSLGVEEQFYLVWPALILGTAALIRLTRRRTRTQATAATRPYFIVLTVVVVISLAMSVVTTYWAPPVAFFSLPTRAWQLGAGAMIALTASRWQQLRPRTAAITGWTGLALITVACTVLTPTTPYPGLAALLPTLGAVAVIAAGCATPTAGCGRALGLAPMQAMGRISYSWYLWHWPILVLAPVWLDHPLGLGGRLLLAALSGVLAALTLVLVENPLRFAPRIRRSARAGLGLGAAVTAVAVVTGYALMGTVHLPVGPGAPATPLIITASPTPPGSPPPAFDSAIADTFAQAQAAVAASVNLRAIPSNLEPAFADVQAEQTAYLGKGCLLTPLQREQPECASGDTASPMRVALIGDSHAAIWDPAFKEVATQRRWRLETMAKAACPVLDLRGANPFRRLVEMLEHCEEWRAGVMARLAAERPQLVVVSVFRGYGVHESLTGFSSYDPEWIDSLTRLVRQLRALGAKVLVLGPVPDLQVAVPICLSKHLDDAAACSAPRSVAVNEQGVAAEAAAAEAGGGRYAQVTDLFCTAERCPPIVGNSMVYIDTSHLTFEYSRRLAPAIGALADQALH